MSNKYKTERAYLASLTPPLAKENSRGRFSREAQAALVEARANGVTFGSEDDSQGNSGPPVAKAAGGHSPSVVREWARANGYDVPSRGRISADVMAAYTGNPLTPKAPTGQVANPVPVQVKLRKAITLYGLTEEGYRVGYSHCRRCVQSMVYCACKDGPKPPKIIVQTLDRLPA